jgi:hypothetical protein
MFAQFSEENGPDFLAVELGEKAPPVNCRPTAAISPPFMAPSFTVAAPSPGVSPEQAVDPAQLLAWFTEEHPVLLRAVDQAAASPLMTRMWQAAWFVAFSCPWQGKWPDF